MNYRILKSDSHISLVRESNEYWNWSFEEMAKYDMPAVIDYIYQNTSEPINYVGHSQGSLQIEQIKLEHAVLRRHDRNYRFPEKIINRKN